MAGQDKWLPDELSIHEGEVVNEKIVKITTPENGEEKTVELFLKCGNQKSTLGHPIYYKFKYNTKKDLSEYEKPEDIPIDDKCDIIFEAGVVCPEKEYTSLFYIKEHGPITFKKTDAFGEGNLTFETLHKKFFPNVGEVSVLYTIESFFKDKQLKDQQKKVWKWLGFDENKKSLSETLYDLKEGWNKQIKDLKEQLEGYYVADIKNLNLESIKGKQYVKITFKDFREMYDKMVKYGNFEQRKSGWNVFNRLGCACFSTKDLDFDNSNEISNK